MHHGNLLGHDGRTFKDTMSILVFYSRGMDDKSRNDSKANLSAA